VDIEKAERKVVKQVLLEFLKNMREEGVSKPEEIRIKKEQWTK